MTAVGRAVRSPDGRALAGLSISMPSVRYDPHRLRSWVAALGLAARAIEHDLQRKRPSLVE